MNMKDENKIKKDKSNYLILDIYLCSWKNLKGWLEDNAMASLNEDKELLRYAGDFRLELCNIISYRTDPDNATESLRINILPQLMNLSIVEDISMECITGEIDLADAQDIRTVLPLRRNLVSLFIYLLGIFL